jgi:peptidyl-prolyl cis-trans isomerase C
MSHLRLLNLRLFVVAATCLCLCARSLSAADAAGEGETTVAKVNGEPVTFNQVKRTLMHAVGNKPVAAEIVPMLQAQALEQAINRRLVLHRLQELNLRPTADELRQAQENFDTNLALGNLTRDEFLRRNFLSAQDLDDLRYWDICWNRYARDQLRDENLKQFFDEHRRDYDGTELRVSHVLWRLEGRGPQADLNLTIQTAARVREEIIAGKLTFADAASKYSAGPSGERGGDLGFIPRHDQMVEEFSSAAFKLKKGEISPPIVTAFGVHLITVVDERPGKMEWTDIRDKLYPLAQNELFRRVAATLRKTAKIEYTNLVPHLDPATGQVVMPAK